MKPYRFSHCGQKKTYRYEYDVYRSGSYDDLVWQEEKGILEREVAMVRQRIPHVRYLDFACGTGRIIAHLEEKMAVSVGVDISSDMLVLARKKVKQSRLIEADLTENDVLGGAQFDIITTFRFFLNAEPSLRVAALNIISSKLAQNGVFIFNIHGNTWSFRLPMVWWYRLRAKQLNHLSAGQMNALLTSFGLMPVRLYGFGLVPKIFYRFFPQKALLWVDHLFSLIPLFASISYNLIFVCQKRNV